MLKCYVDADWAGSWLRSYLSSPAGVLSRSGILIKYANCPILWGSKMQSLVALSTTEAEIIALSTAWRSRNYCPFHSLARSDPPTESLTRTPGLRVPYTIY